MGPVAVDVAVLSIGAAADEASTRYALKHCAGCYEGNPLMSEPAIRLVGKAAAVSALTLGCHELRKHGHGGMAKGLRWVAFAAWMGIAAHNVAVTR